jgi:hypothetical protein
MVETLQRIRQEHGDEDFQHALRGLFRDLLSKDEGLAYIERLLEALGQPAGIDLEALKVEAREKQEKQVVTPSSAETPMQTPAKTPAKTPAETPAETPAQMIEDAIKQAIPNCKTQAHFDLILHAWQALQIYINAAYGFDQDSAAKAREGINRLLDLAPQLAATHQKIEEHPEATTNRDFVDPPRQTTEVLTQQVLLAELSGIAGMDELETWYRASRGRMASIASQRLRNELFDAIREKKHRLEN